MTAHLLTALKMFGVFYLAACTIGAVEWLGDKLGIPPGSDR